MATATGEVAYDFSSASNENPWSLADGGGSDPFVVRNGMTARIITNALRSNFNTNGYCCYVDQAIDQDDFEVKGETLQGGGSFGDQVGVGGINSSGNGYILWINGNLWRIYQIDAFVIGGGTNLTLSHTALDVISLQYSYSGGTATLTAKRNGSTVGLSVTDSTSPYYGDLEPCWFFNFDNSNAGGFKSIALDGIAASLTIDTFGTARPGESVSITTTGLGTLTTATTIGGKAITAASAPSGDGSITVADFADGVAYPAMGTVTVVASDGTNTATKTDAALAAYTGYLTVTLASPFDETEFSLYNAWPPGDPPQTGEVLHFPSDGTGVVNSDLTLTDFAVGVHLMWVRRYDGVMYSFEADISADTVTLVIGDSSHSQNADNLSLTQANTITIQESLHGHSADGLILTQQHTIAISEAAHAHTVDNLVLNQANTIGIQDSIQSQNADNLNLTQANTLSISDAGQSQSVDNLTLTQAHTIAIQKSTHGHTVDNVVLVSAGVLSITDAVHSHLSDNLTLTQANILSIADSSQSHSADNLVLSTAVNLSISDSTQAHLADNLALTQASSIVISDTLHGQTADSFALTQASTLSIQESAHSHTSDNITLDVSWVLSINDVLHAQSADNLNLVQAGILSISDSSHAHTADAIVLTQANILQIADALHSQSADNLTITEFLLLQIQDALHAHFADNVAISPNYILSIQSADHAHRADNVTFPGTIFIGDNLVYCDAKINVVLIDVTKHVVLVQDQKHVILIAD